MGKYSSNFMLEMLYIIFIALFGLSIGSFLNVVILRLHDKKTFFGRSECPKCLHKLSFLDLIPLFSFLFLKCRCRYCKEKISWQYFLVELSTAALFVAAFVLNYFFREFNWLFFVRDIIFITSIIVIFVYDIKYMEIPDEISIPAASIVAMLSFLINKNIESIMLGGTIGACFFLIQFIMSKGKWMGGGDVRLGLLMGVMLGPVNVVMAIFLSYLAGAIYSIPVLIKKYTNKDKIINSEIALAPFLAIGSLIVLFFGNIFANFLK